MPVFPTYANDIGRFKWLDESIVLLAVVEGYSDLPVIKKPKA
jgi:hypothetical protein